MQVHLAEMHLRKCSALYWGAGSQKVTAVYKHLSH